MKDLKNKFDAMFDMDVARQLDIVVNDLVNAGFDKYTNTAMTKTYNYEYSKAGCDYSLIYIEPKKFAERRIPVIVDKYVFDESLNKLNFESVELPQESWKSYHTMFRPRVNKLSAELNVAGRAVHDYIMPTDDAHEVDHRFHSIFINSFEALRPVTKEQNQMNIRNRKSDCQLEYKYKPEEDFGRTWYLYVYWRMLGLISKEEAFAYNLEKNK